MTATAARAANPFDVMHLGWSFMRSKVVMAAMELGLFASLAESPKSVEELRADLDIHPRGAQDFFDTLASLGVVVRDDDRYRNSVSASMYLVPASPSYLGGFLSLTTTFMGPSWDTLAETLRTGVAHKEDEKGDVPFAQIFRDPVKLRSFLAAMDSLNGPIGPALAEIVPTEDVRSFVDLGGARGNLAGHLVSRHPRLRGAVLDRPAMRDFFDERMREMETTECVTFHGGDFFGDPIPEADMAIFGNVLHDFSAEQRVALMKRAHDMLPAGGAIVVYDPMIDDERTDTGNLLMSLSMMLQSPGGSEYTAEECRTYMREAGFTVAGTHPLPASATAVVGHKR